MNLSTRIYRKLELELRQLTSPLRCEPNLLIIGAQKAGTSSLYDYLSKHPNITAAYKKEVRFFNAHYKRGTNWYHAHFPLKHFQSHQNIIFEASPGYILYPSIPNRVAKLNPDMKIIALLRNPIHRAYSHYKMNLQRSNVNETLPFADAIAEEEIRLRSELPIIQNPQEGYSDSYSFYSYLARGRYWEQLQHWFNQFPAEQIKIIQAERFFADTATIFADVLDFLDVPQWQPSQFEVINYSGATENLKQKIGQELYEQLQTHFAPHNEMLYEQLGTRYDWD